MRKILSVLLICLLLVCSAMPVFAAQDKTVRNFNELENAINAIGEDEEVAITLANDIVLEKGICFNFPCTVTFRGPAAFIVKCGEKESAFCVAADDVKLYFEDITITDNNSNRNFTDDGRYIYQRRKLPCKRGLYKAYFCQ